MKRNNLCLKIPSTYHRTKLCVQIEVALMLDKTWVIHQHQEHIEFFKHIFYLEATPNRSRASSRWPCHLIFQQITSPSPLRALWLALVMKSSFVTPLHTCDLITKGWFNPRAWPGTHIATPKLCYLRLE